MKATSNRSGPPSAAHPSDMGATQQPDGAPPVDTVLLWITNVVECDLVQRGAFPHLRHAAAKAYRGNASLHYATPADASRVLADALERESALRGPTRVAFAAHVKAIRAAMKEAAERPGIFSAPTAACLNRSEWRERWAGTKDQLRLLGIHLPGPWPRGPGGGKRWSQTVDGRGYKTVLTPACAVWPGRFEAAIDIPMAARPKETTPASGPGKASRARESLAAMPASADAFRRNFVGSARAVIRSLAEFSAKPSARHGYSIDPDSVVDIQASFDAVVEAIVEARIVFDAARHAEVAQGHRADIAAGDEVFQARFARLTTPNAAILQGEAS